MRVSIIIPTRERAFYLRHCLQTVLDIDDDDIEIIVSNTKAKAHDFFFTLIQRRKCASDNFDNFLFVKLSVHVWMVFVLDDIAKSSARVS